MESEPKSQGLRNNKNFSRRTGFELQDETAERETNKSCPDAKVGFIFTNIFQCT